MESILTSIKKLLGVAEDYEHYDVDITIHINSSFSRLKRLGVGPTKGFKIKDKTAVWSDFIPADSNGFEDVKTYVYLRAKLWFDANSLSSTVIQAMKEDIKELEWNLNVEAETPITVGEGEIQNGE